jgi:hypothetical protein
MFKSYRYRFCRNSVRNIVFSFVSMTFTYIPIFMNYTFRDDLYTSTVIIVKTSAVAFHHIVLGYIYELAEVPGVARENSILYS